LEAHRNGTLLTVWVVPAAKRTEILGPHGDALKIRVAAPPEAGRANRELVRLLERMTNSKVTLQRGATSRRKTVLVEGQTPADVAMMLDAACG
jgi:hypothetical protein